MRILGYFPSLKAANEAFRLIRAEGVAKAYVDAKNVNNDITNSLPGTSLRTSISEPVSNSPTFSSTVSNTSQMDGSVNNNFSYTLVVDADEVNIDNIKNIISEMGGIVEEDSTPNGLK
jgi:hypothetical protein